MQQKGLADVHGELFHGLVDSLQFLSGEQGMLGRDREGTDTALCAGLVQRSSQPIQVSLLEAASTQLIRGQVGGDLKPVGAGVWLDDRCANPGSE